jgi:hypothetical protein
VRVSAHWRRASGCGSYDGDVTKLGEAGVGSGFPFLLEFGLFHDELKDEQRQAMGAEVTAVAAPGATLPMMAWAPGRRGPLPRGASRRDIEAAFPAWSVVDEEPVDTSVGARSLEKGSPLLPDLEQGGPTLYRLRRD